MKSSNTCPKCRSRKVVKMKGGNSQTHKIAYGKWGVRHEKFDRYVCIRCGFKEDYAKLSDKFVKWANDNLPKGWEEQDNDFV